MPDSAQFALHRPEVSTDLQRGERKIIDLMRNTAVVLPPGKTLFQANGQSDYVYRLVDGWACRSCTLDDGRKQLILIFLPGDLLAIKSLLAQSFGDNAHTLSAAVVERVDRRTLLRAFREDADIATRCLWQVIEEERRLQRWIIGLGQASAEERLAMLLIDFRCRLALSGKIAADSLTFRMPLTQVELADLLGLTPVHVNRVLKSLREQGIATLRSGQVTILDWESLRRCARHLLDTYEQTTLHYAGAIPTGVACPLSATDAHHPAFDVHRDSRQVIDPIPPERRDSR